MSRSSARRELLRGLEDENIQDYFIEKAFAEEHLVRDSPPARCCCSTTCSTPDGHSRRSVGSSDVTAPASSTLVLSPPRQDVNDRPPFT